jgi:hypothetical protein
MRAISWGTLGLGGIAAVAIGLGKRQLDRTYPRIPVDQLPRSSASRYLIEKSAIYHDESIPNAWGMQRSCLLPSWSDTRLTHWIPSIVAIQIETPVSLLAGYKSADKDPSTDASPDPSHATDDRPNDVDHLMRNLVAAFLDARTWRPDGLLLDRNVPSLSFEAGSHLFGDRSSLAAYMFGTWSSKRGSLIHLPALPTDVPVPCSGFPSGESFAPMESSIESAGTVLYWNFPDSVIQKSNKAASYGLPWRLMDGGFQEFVVEKISDEKARVTYISVECSNLYPHHQVDRDFKRPSKLMYEVHVSYGQALLLDTISQLKKSQQE